MAATERGTVSVDTRDESPWAMYLVVFLAPAALVYSVFSILPLLDTVRLSLYEADPTGATHFVGFKNFAYLLKNKDFAEPIAYKPRAKPTRKTQSVTQIMAKAG